MKYLKYVLRNATRNRLRTSLTVLSVAVSLAMITVLYGYLEMQKVWSREAGKYNRLVVMHIMGFAGKLPIAHLDQVRAMPGVRAAVPYSWYGGSYKDQRAFFAQFGTDPERAFEVWDEFQIDPGQLADWKKNPTGCVVERRLAEEQHWKVGDRIPLKGNIYEFDLDLTLCGIYDAPNPTNALWFHWKYLDEGLRRTGSKRDGNAGILFVRAESSAAIPALVQRIDERYASSEFPTRTQTEQAFAQMFSQMLGNIQLLIRNISMAVVFSLTLVAANAMAMSMRERTTEIAVLKAIGYQRGLVLGLILGESLVISVIGGLLGVGAGRGLFAAAHHAVPQIIPIDHLGGGVVLGGLATAAVIGLASGFLPAVRAAQLPVIDGLRRVV